MAGAAADNPGWSAVSDTIKCGLCANQVTRDMTEFGYRPVGLFVPSPSGRLCGRWGLRTVC